MHFNLSWGVCFARQLPQSLYFLFKDALLMFKTKKNIGFHGHHKFSPWLFRNNISTTYGKRISLSRDRGYYSFKNWEFIRKDRRNNRSFAKLGKDTVGMQRHVLECHLSPNNFLLIIS
uniref:Uncharacterized protein n=1 Tax=Solanum tuberosum TaxID=4113 RepID=M1C400_SOLTU